jgi:hypothetical protein
LELAFVQGRSIIDGESESDWTELGKHPSTGRTAEDRSKWAKKAAATQKEREHHQQHK